MSKRPDGMKPAFVKLAFIVVGAAWMLGLAACAAGIEEYAPASPAESTWQAGDGQAVAPEPTLAPTAQPQIHEARRLNLEWPSHIRVGDSRFIYVTLEIDEQGNITPTVAAEGDQVRGETVFIPDLYETHDVMVTGRLDMAGMEISPKDEVSESLRPGQAAHFIWSVRPREVGIYQGVISLHLRFIPHPGNESGRSEQRSLLSNQPITIEAVNFLGLGGTPARLVGILGTFLGSVLGLDNLISWTWQRVRKKPAAQ
jgi:hypothetical protein